jgi:hypothetical protein
MTKIKAADATVSRVPKQLTPFKPGQSGNPKGRPKGSRNKLGEDFLSALQADFEKHGSETIVKVREERPHEYLKVIAGILPKELNVNTSRVEEMSDDELADGIAALQSILAAQAAQEGSSSPSKH